MDTQITLLPGNIVYGGDSSESFTQSYRSLGHLVLELLKQHGDKILYINGSTDEKYSASFLRQSIIRLAYILKGFGVKQNDVVALCVGNSIEYAIALYACFSLNVAVTPMNETYTEGELHHTISLSKPKLIFASNTSYKNVLSVVSKVDFVKAVILTNEVKSLPNVFSVKTLMTDQKIKSNDDIYVPKAEMDDVAIIYYSSGTTGLPKGVLLTQMNYLKWFDAQISSTAFQQLETGLTVLPWTHVYGGLTVLGAVANGKTTIFFERYTPSSFLGSIERYNVTHCFLVPTILVFLAKNEEVLKYNFSSVKLLFSGAGALKADTITQVKERLKIPAVIQGYGMTETTCGVIIQDPLKGKKGSIGIPQNGVYVKIIDPKTGEALGFNNPGEICVKGNLIMKGYLSNEKATKEAIIDGWLHTGDVGYFDKDFNFFVVDRIKDLIKYKSHQVAPAELEYIIQNHPSILDVAVAGKPDEECGELPTAFVVPDPKQKVSEKEIMDFVAERVSPSKRLRGGVIFVSEIPKTYSGKILRRELKAKFFAKSKL